MTKISRLDFVTPVDTVGERRALRKSVLAGAPHFFTITDYPERRYYIVQFVHPTTGKQGPRHRVHYENVAAAEEVDVEAVKPAKVEAPKPALAAEPAKRSKLPPRRPAPAPEAP